MVEHRWEDFCIGGQKVGFLERRTRDLGSEARLTETLTAFMFEDAVSRIHHRLWWTDDDPPSWSRYTMEVDGKSPIEVTNLSGRLKRQADGSVDQWAVDPTAFPGYASFVFLARLALHEGALLGYEQLQDESAEPAGLAVLAVKDAEEVEVSWSGERARLIRVEETVQGAYRNTFWMENEGDVLVSDWCGARSYRVSGAEEALAGLGEPLRPLG